MLKAENTNFFSLDGTIVPPEKIASKPRKTGPNSGKGGTVVPLTRKGIKGEKVPCPAWLAPAFLADLADLSATALSEKYSREWNSHRNMKTRSKDKGLQVHPAFDDFSDFLRCVGPMPVAGATLDRIDNDDPEYAPGKVRWADKHTQNNNKGDTGTYFDPKTHQTFTTSQLAAKQGVPANTIRKRRRRGWTDEEIIAGTRAKRFDADVRPQYAHFDDLQYAWREACRETFPDLIVLPFTGKERRHLSEFAKLLCPLAVPPTTAITTCISNWAEFSCMAKSYQAAWGLTEVPTVEFFCRSALAAVNFTAQRMPKVEDPHFDATGRLWLRSQM